MRSFLVFSSMMALVRYVRNVKEFNDKLNNGFRRSRKETLEFLMLMVRVVWKKEWILHKKEHVHCCQVQESGFRTFLIRTGTVCRDSRQLKLQSQYRVVQYVLYNVTKSLSRWYTWSAAQRMMEECVQYSFSARDSFLRLHFVPYYS